jgi:hypothetical protein
MASRVRKRLWHTCHHCSQQPKDGSNLGSPIHEQKKESRIYNGILLIQEKGRKF